MVAGFLVMFMQAGFALVETGLTRAKNVAHTMGMNFLVYAIGIIGFYFVGFGLQMGGVGPGLRRRRDARRSEFTVNLFGKDFGLFGMSGFVLPLVDVHAGRGRDLPLPDGLHGHHLHHPHRRGRPSAGRSRSFVLFSFVISTIIYPIYANWVWGGGWLSTLGTNFGLGHGHVDFAGSSVVHMTGGVMALVLAKMIGPRIGKYGPDGRVNPIAAAQHPAGHDRHLHPGLRLVRLQRRLDPLRHGHPARRRRRRTPCSPAPPAPSPPTSTSRSKFGKADPSWLANGMLAGLVAITAPCAFVSSWAAMLIGAIAGVLVVLAAHLHRHQAQDRRPGRRHRRPRRERRLRRPRPRPLRQRHLRRGAERRGRRRHRPASTATRASSAPRSSASSPTSLWVGPGRGARLLRHRQDRAATASTPRTR